MLVLKTLIPSKIRFYIGKNCNLYRSYSERINVGAKILFEKCKRRLMRPRFPGLSHKTINLHLGCGGVNHPDFINIDAFPHSHVHYIRAIEDLSPFDDQTADLIYACHCLEHFPYAQVPYILSEWHRVLKVDGILRLSVPDFDLILEIYKDRENNVNSILGPLMGGHADKYDFHKTIFNQRYLKQLLIESGFREVREWLPGSCSLTSLNDWSSKTICLAGKEYAVSLNIEAIK